MGMGATVFSLVYARVEWLLSKSFLSFQFVPFVILWLGKAGFSWDFFWSVPIGILVSQLPQYPDWDI